MTEIFVMNVKQRGADRMKPFISVLPSDEFCGIAFMCGYWSERIVGISLQIGWLEIAIGIIGA